MGPLAPRPAPADPTMRARMQRDRLRSAAGWLIGGVATAHLAGLMMPWGGSDAVAWAGFAAAAMTALAMLGLGAAQLVLLVRAQRERLGVAAGIGIATALGLLLAPLAGLLTFAFGLVHFIVPLAAAAVGILLLAGRLPGRTVGSRPWLGSAVGVLVGAGVLAAGVIDSLVLLPLHLAPGMPLPDIRAQLAVANEDGGVWMPLAWGGLWLAAMIVLAAGLLRSRRGTAAALGTLLAASALAVFGLPATQFSIGMGIADTFGVGGGVSAAFPVILAAAAALTAGAAALLIGAVNAGRR